MRTFLLARATAATLFERWRAAGKKVAYDPNTEASRSEMRTFVCAQCHIEYYCSSAMKLTAPWGKGLNVDQVEAFWDEQNASGGEPVLYRAGEWGPAAADEMLARDGRAWRRP